MGPAALRPGPSYRSVRALLPLCPSPSTALSGPYIPLCPGPSTALTGPFFLPLRPGPTDRSIWALPTALSGPFLQLRVGSSPSRSSIPSCLRTRDSRSRSRVPISTSVHRFEPDRGPFSGPFFPINSDFSFLESWFIKGVDPNRR